MIRSMGKETFFTYSQTLNRSWNYKVFYLSKKTLFSKNGYKALSGPFLVSRTGDVG